jgi:3-hydroxyisobutyrate dehydrogenase
MDTSVLAKRLDEIGVQVVDAPVSGNVSKAVTGELTIMAGGQADALEHVRPALEAMSRKIFHVGDVASGHAMKALNNLVSAAGLIAAGEAMLIGKKFGLESKTMLDVLNLSTGRNNSTENKFERFVLSRKFDGGFALGLMAKDVSIALDLARATETPALHSALTREIVGAANLNEPQGSDHTAVVRWLESISAGEL